MTIRESGLILGTILDQQPRQGHIISILIRTFQMIVFLGVILDKGVYQKYLVTFHYGLLIDLLEGLE